MEDGMAEDDGVDEEEATAEDDTAKEDTAEEVIGGGEGEVAGSTSGVGVTTVKQLTCDS